MKGSIPESKIEEIRQRADIVGLISEYVALKKAGRNHLGSCPFHKEKTPSFTVNPEKQIFYCFGCGQGGNVYSFLMKINNMTFPEAVRHLAGKLGIALPKTFSEEEEKRRSGLKQELYRVNALARDFFARQLFSDAGKSGREHLRKRGIREEVVREFRLGYAPPAWRYLRDFFQRRGTDLSLVEKSGLIISKGKGDYYDRFRGRLLFPIEDIQGNVVAFGGRIIGEGEPKYLNSPESPVYIKGNNLYGLNRSRDDVRKADGVIVVEGYFDFLSLWNAGIRNVVATLGTAMTTHHADLIKRYTKNVYSLFDPDQGGKKALERSISLFLGRNMLARVVVLPEGRDPDDFVRSSGRKALEDILSGARSAVDYYIDEMIGTRKTLEENLASLREAIPFMARIDDPVERNLFVKRVAERLQVDEALLKKEVGKAPGAEEESALEGAGRPGRLTVDPVELSLIYMMVEKPARIDQARNQRVLDFFSNRELKKVGQSLEEIRQADQKVSVADFIEGLADGALKKKLLEYAFSDRPADEGITERVFVDAVKKVKTRWYREKHRELKTKLIRAQERGDAELCHQLLREKERLLNEQKAL
ncbi:MAG TPA: DNA primase [Syntrophales bacterium]|nr:DNA primase [Syntrophales bacterium]HOX94967.1 DNA primase [Syntrophales bacterium]HPI58369.1 DNA primase [Syntrophales bacterium]HPN25999.1 DNA primase [Syntrophales bacterium]HQM30570.1 DNA primase [Syntrophales bacterium]